MVFSRTALVSALVLAACGQGPSRVEVTGGAQDVRFTVVAAEGGGQSCVDRLSVTPLKPEGADPVWQVTAVDPNQCMATLRYGVPTGRFAQAATAIPLRAGAVYRVRASGAGFSAVRDFRVTPEHVVLQD